MRTFLLLALIISINCGIFDVYDCIAIHLDNSPIALKVLELLLKGKVLDAISMMLSNLEEFNDILELCIYGEPEDEPFDDTIIRIESENIVNKLFDFSYSFKSVPLDEEITIYAGNPKITAKITSSCSIIFKGNNSGFIKIQGSTVVSESGVKTTFTNPFIEKIKEIYNFNIKDLSINFEQKLKGVIVDGIVSFRISMDKIEFAFNLEKTTDYSSCEGALIISIYPGIDPPKYPAYNPDIYNDVIVEAAKYGAIATGVFVLIKNSCIIVGGVISGIAKVLLGLLAF